MSKASEWGKEGEQRAYRSMCGCVHFYPSHCWRICRANGDDPQWYDDRPKMAGECASMFIWEKDFKPEERLAEADALAVWGTRAAAIEAGRSE